MNNFSQINIETAASVIKNDGVVCFPTQYLYGLAANPFSQPAVDKVFAIKGRAPKKPLLLIIPDVLWVPKLAEVTPMAEKLMQAFWPGPLTLVLRAQANIPALAGSNKVGLRLDSHPMATLLAQAVGYPITATSANPSGEAAIADLGQLDTGFKAKLSYILDCGRLPGGAGSTVVDVSDNVLKVLRAGVILEKELLTSL